MPPRSKDAAHGKALGRLIADAGITGREAIKALGVSAPYYSLIRNGKRPLPDLSKKSLLALKLLVQKRVKAGLRLLEVLS